MKTASEITVHTSFVAFHCWPEAPATRGYLRSEHRHRFAVTATVSVDHDDREIEFHDLLEEVDAEVQGWGMDLGRASCEDLARRLVRMLYFAHPGRQKIAVSVFEDGEVGATVTQLAQEAG